MAVVHEEEATVGRVGKTKLFREGKKQSITPERQGHVIHAKNVEQWKDFFKIFQ